MNKHSTVDDMSRTRIALLIGAVITLGGLALRLAAHSLATSWEILGPNAWAGTTDAGTESMYQTIGATVFVFGLVLLALVFYRWLLTEPIPPRREARHEAR